MVPAMRNGKEKQTETRFPLEESSAEDASEKKSLDDRAS